MCHLENNIWACGHIEETVISCGHPHSEAQNYTKRQKRGLFRRLFTPAPALPLACKKTNGRRHIHRMCQACTEASNLSWERSRFDHLDIEASDAQFYAARQEQVNHQIKRKPVPQPSPSVNLRRRRTSTQIARDAGKEAMIGYGWHNDARDSAALPPHLVSQFINISGTNTASLPSPTPRPATSSRVNDDPTGINWDRWFAAEQTNHGRLPPAPEEPLPQPPLRDSAGRPLGGDSRTVIPRNPRSVSPLDKEEDEFPDSPVSQVENSRYRSIQASRLTSAASSIDFSLHNALDAWEEPKRGRSTRR